MIYGILDRRKQGFGGQQPSARHRFTMATLRGVQQPERSKKLFKMIKTENHAIDSYESAGRDRISVAAQLSEWGEGTGDHAVSDLSDKLGVILAEIGEQEDVFAQGLEDSRNVLKHIRNTESSVQPARDRKSKILDEIHKLKQKDAGNQRVTTLEQELVRAEAEALVAEAQLTNMVSISHPGV
jgi:small-conductance mechanosensitive channel